MCCWILQANEIPFVLASKYFNKNMASSIDDLNELLGSDNEDNVEEEEKAEGSAVDDNNQTENIDENTNNTVDKVELNELLGDSDDEKDNEEKAITPEEAEEAKADVTDVPVDDLDQILGKPTVSIVSSRKVKKTSKLHIGHATKIPADAKSLFVRTPNFLKIQSSPFDSETFDAEKEKEIYDGAATIVRFRMKTDNRGIPLVNDDGKHILESNARLIKWDDGSYQLVVGKAVFNSKIMSTENLFAFEEHRSLDPSSNNNDGEDDTNAHSGNCLECIGGVDRRMILQPLSLNSSTHTRVSMKISERFKKEQRILKQESDGNMERPEVSLANLAKKEEEEMKQLRKQQLQAQEYRPSGFGGGDVYAASKGKAGRPSMSSSYLDEIPYEEMEEERNRSVRMSSKKKPSTKVKPSNNKKREREEEEDDEEEDLDDKAEEDEEEEDEDGDDDSIIVPDDEMEDEDDDENNSDENDDENDNDGDDDGGEEGASKKIKRKEDKKNRKKAKKEEKKRKKMKKEKAEKVHSKKAAMKSKNIEDAKVATAEESDAEEEKVNLHYNKRLKRTVIDSDDEDEA